MFTCFFKKLNQVAMILFITLFLLSSFYQIELFTYFLSVLTLVIFFTGIGYMSSFNKYVSVVLIGLGTFFLCLDKNSLTDICLAITHNSGIVNLLLTIPLLGIVFHYDDYEKYVTNLAIRYMNTELKFYSLTSVITSFFGVFMNLGSIPFVYQFLYKHSKNFPDSLLFKAINRGFFSNMLWTPSCIAVAVIIEYFDFSWQQIAPMGISLAILAHILAILMERFFSFKNKTCVNLNISPTSFSRKETLKLFVLVTILISSVIIFDLFTGKSFLVIMSLVSLIVPFVLSIIYHKMNIFKEKAKEFIDSLDDKNNEFILFSAIGFFAFALRYTNIGEYIVAVINALGLQSQITLIPFFILLVLGLSIIGVHPIITISTIALTLPIDQLPISVEQLSFSLLIGYSLYQLVSPFSTAVLVMTAITHKNPLDICININKLFVISYVVLSSLILIIAY